MLIAVILVIALLAVTISDPKTIQLVVFVSLLLATIAVTMSACSLSVHMPECVGDCSEGKSRNDDKSTKPRPLE